MIDSQDGTCAHCELPLGRRFATASIDGEPRRFCCYGCVLAQQITRAQGEPGAAAAILIRLGLAVFCTMNVMALSLPTYAVHVYGAAALPADGPLLQVLRVLSAGFALPVLLLLGGPVVASAVRALRTGALTADALIVLGASAAYGVSVANLMQGMAEVYFDTASMLLVIVTVGRYLEARAKADASSLVKRTFSPVASETVRIGDGITEVVAAEQLCPGDIVRVVPGEGFPSDGLILNGEGGVDESLLTGESLPVRKQPGLSVAGGTCSVDGTFEVLVTARRDESATARIAKLLSEALRQRGQAERFADAATRVFVPVVVSLAVVTGAAWGVLRGIDTGVLNGLSVLVVACPCALGIATPVALWMGLLEAARRGVVVRSAAALERAATIDHVIFDKTGTLTSTMPALSRVVVAPGRSWTPERALITAAALENHLKHPIARALTAAARQQSTRPWSLAAKVHVRPGIGVCGEVDGRRIEIGRVDIENDDAGEWLRKSGVTETGVTAILRDEQGPIAAFGFREQVNVSAAPAITRLRDAGLSVEILSGDRDLRAVVPALVEKEAAFAGLTPDAKLSRIRERRRTGSVAMIGDGFNDAPALAAADLGIAVGGAVDLTRVTADVLLVGEDLRRIPWLLGHTRRVRRIMAENLAWAVGYNGIAVLLAMMGKLTPVAAAVVMVASSFVVIANSRRLLRSRGTQPAPFSRPCEDGTPEFPDFPTRLDRFHTKADGIERHAP